MTIGKKQLTKHKEHHQIPLDERKRKITAKEVPETNEIEIKKVAEAESPEMTIRYPKDIQERFQMMPEEFSNVQDAIQASFLDKRRVEVYADSLESYLGYDSLLRVMGKHYTKMVVFYRDNEGLSIEDARKAVYRRGLTDEEGLELFNKLMSVSTEHIGFGHLMELNDYSPAMAQNLWEMIKREAAREFESGHRAAAALEPVDYMTDAWNRASYIGLRESLIEEWQPKGGIELTMIDTIAQALLMLQHWTTESCKRAKTDPRQENYKFVEWKRWNQQANSKQWDNGYWDLPYVHEQRAVEHAAQMADRWQRMYFRAIRNLRDWRRYTPQVTINNPQQVNIANDGGQQINVSQTKEDLKKIIP